MPLQIAYRPQNLDEFFGNQSIKDSLLSIFAREDRPHTYLFHGPSGCGKTTLARIIGKMSGCSDMDIHEYNAANTRGIDTIREIVENMGYSGMITRQKMYILDEVHQITSQAKEATLKMLEEPPPHVTFVLCTTEPDKLPKTVHTRSTTYQVSLLQSNEMSELLDWVMRSESIKKFPDKALKEIIRVSEGCPRDALKLLDQVVDIKDEKKMLDAIKNFSLGEAEVIEICRGLAKRESWDMLRGKISLVLKGTEPEKLRYAILGYFTTILLNEKGWSKPVDMERASVIIDLFSDNTYSSGKAGIVNMTYLASKK